MIRSNLFNKSSSMNETVDVANKINASVNACDSTNLPSGKAVGVTRKSLSIAIASLVLAAVALPATAANWYSLTPTLKIGTTVVNVRNVGAMGNGTSDDTVAFQSAINALPATGGTVVVPDGTYMINALKGISLRSNTHLSMTSGAKLVAIANSAQRYWVLKVWGVNNVEISGGQVVGERVGHTGTGGEWGYGINISGSNLVSVHDIAVSNSWGDGLLVGATGSGANAVLSTGVTLNHVTSTNNRRQGLTIAPCRQVYVVNSSFTNSNGTAPQDGIDIEPMTQGNVQQVRIENTVVSDNAGNGMEIQANVAGVVFTGSTAENNKGYGVFANGATNVLFTNSTLEQNYLFGAAIQGTTSNAQVIGNTVMWNGAAWFYAHNQPVTTEGWAVRDITIASTTSNVSATGNVISPER